MSEYLFDHPIWRSLHSIAASHEQRTIAVWQVYTTPADAAEFIAAVEAKVASSHPTLGGGAYPPSDPHIDRGSRPRHPRPGSNPHAAPGAGAQAADDAAR